jgi:hypothetical protein
MVGISVLAKETDANSSKKHQRIDPVKNIDSILSERHTELIHLPQHLCNLQEAYILFAKLLESMKERLNRTVIEEDFKRFQDDRGMHCTVRMQEVFAATRVSWMGVKFLGKEREMLEKAKGVGFPTSYSI